MHTFTRVGVLAATAALAASVASGSVASAQDGTTDPYLAHAALDDPSSVSITGADAFTATGTFTNRSGSELHCFGVVTESAVMKMMEKELRAFQASLAAEFVSSPGLEAAGQASMASGHFGLSEVGTDGSGALLTIPNGATATWKVELGDPANGGARTDFKAGVMVECAAGAAETPTKVLVEFAHEGEAATGGPGTIGGGALGGGSSEGSSQGTSGSLGS